MFGAVNRIKQYYAETVQEIKKCTWPTRPELTESTLVVIIALALLTVFVYAVDTLLHIGVQSLVKISS